MRDVNFKEYLALRLAQHTPEYDKLVEEMYPDDTVIHDFDPSGDEHPGACMCPCCDQAEGKM